MESLASQSSEHHQAAAAAVAAAAAAVVAQEVTGSGGPVAGVSAAASSAAATILNQTSAFEQDSLYASATPKLASQLYDIMPSSMQYALYDFWEMYHNPELNKYQLFNGGPWLVILFLGSYLYFVLRAGPKMMEKRQAYDLKPLIRLYNFSMVLFNAYLFYHASPFLNFGLWGWGCTKAIQPMPNESIPIVWLVLVSRFCDFFDTVFFILRKKFSHVSFLHVFHHTIVPIGFWIGIKFAFFPVCCFVPYLNLVVHVIMYSYYGLSTFGPAVQKYLWWKKYLTRLQIAQFLIALVHSLQPLYLRQCTFPAIFVMGQTLGALLFLWLFVSFYIKAYAMQRNSTNAAPDASKLKIPEKHQLKKETMATTTTNDYDNKKRQ
uniref:Elongation of very long chain fatty acids protein n=1 Tax=Aceria tosichella TaxID=561515 RepID=A0A6G1SFQ1_9ACAR